MHNAVFEAGGLNWTFTPTLSFQLFAQPFVSSGDYDTYKELARPKSYDFINYGENGTTFDAETLTADPDGDGPAAAIEADNIFMVKLTYWLSR